MTPLLFTLPWLLLLAFVEFVVRMPRELPREASPDRGGSRPSVSIIVPARNEAHNITTCLTSLAALEYDDFEIIVVDDRSEDETAELARSVGRGNATRLGVVSGEPLPEEWLGKPWACRQGALVARGDLLLFTDADTTHGPALLDRAVEARREEDADLLTLVGRQLTGTFWERVVQPHIFLMMMMRFPDFERVARNTRWRDAIANGQYLLFTKGAYHAIGGHEAVRDEVVEDLALAQHVKRAGLRLRVRSAENELATRMYRSLRDLVDGWSKNIVIGGHQSFPHWMRPLVVPISLLGEIGLWLIAPAVLVAAFVVWLGGDVVFGGASFNALEGQLSLRGTSLGDALFRSTIFGGQGGLLTWAATVYLLSVVLWARFARRMHVAARFGPLFPLGAGVATWILIRSWVRGRNVEWKGRRYHLRPTSERQ